MPACTLPNDPPPNRLLADKRAQQGEYAKGLGNRRFCDSKVYAVFRVFLAICVLTFVLRLVWNTNFRNNRSVVVTGEVKPGFVAAKKSGQCFDSPSLR